MRFADFWENAPRCLLVAIEGVSDRPAALIEIGECAPNRDALRLASAGNVKFELAEVQIAVVLAARTVFGEAIVGENLKPDSTDFAEFRFRMNRDGVLLRTLAA